MGLGIFESLRRTLTGTVIKKTSVTLGNKTTISFRLKANGNDRYVVMACTAIGNHQYYPMDLHDFQTFTDAVLATKAEIDNTRTSG